MEASLKFRITKEDISHIRLKMRIIDKKTISQSNSKLLTPKFNFEADFRGNFLFLKGSSFAKSRDSQKSKKSDFSITQGHVAEVIESNLSHLNTQNQPTELRHSDVILPDLNKLGGQNSFEISKSMDISVAQRKEDPFTPDPADYLSTENESICIAKEAVNSHS